MNADRYSRQILFEGIGEDGQTQLARSKAVIIGCGALGSVQTETLARAGVGRLVLVDRDFDDFRAVDALMLPHKYRIQLDVQTSRDQMCLTGT